VSRSFRSLVLCPVVSWLVGAAVAAAQAPAPPQVPPAPTTPVEFVGSIVNMEGGGSAYVTLHVDAFTADDEIVQYLDALKERGMEGVTSMMFKAKQCGYIKIGQLLGYQIAVARSRPTETGRRIVALTDRPMQFFELRNDTRSTDYPLGMLVLELDKNGQGKGTLFAAALAEFGKDGKLELKSYGTQPLKVIRVRTEFPKVEDPK
jgi:hypothetical protein